MFHNNVHKDIGAVFSVYNTGFNTVDEGTEEGSCDAKRERPPTLVQKLCKTLAHAYALIHGACVRCVIALSPCSGCIAQEGGGWAGGARWWPTD